MTYSMSYRTLKLIILCFTTVLFSGCAMNQSSSEVSAEQSKYYDGKSAVPFLAEQQAKSSEEAMNRAIQSFTSGDIDRALFNYIRVIELDNQNSTALVKIGNIHYQRGNYPISFQAYQSAIQIDPQQGEALKGSGMILLHRKSYVMAETSLNRSIEPLLAQQDKTAALVDSYIGLAILNDLRSDYMTSALYYIEAEALAPTSPMVKSNLGYSFYMQEKWSAAEIAFNQALQADSSYSPAWKNLGLTYARQAKYMQALNALEQVMDRSKAYNDIGYICLITQRYEQAAQFFRKAIEEHPQYYETAQQNLTRVKRLLASNVDGYSKL